MNGDWNLPPNLRKQRVTILSIDDHVAVFVATFVATFVAIIVASFEGILNFFQLNPYPVLNCLSMSKSSSAFPKETLRGEEQVALISFLLS